MVNSKKKRFFSTCNQLTRAIFAMCLCDVFSNRVCFCFMRSKSEGKVRVEFRQEKERNQKLPQYCYKKKKRKREITAVFVEKTKIRPLFWIPRQRFLATSVLLRRKKLKNYVLMKFRLQKSEKKPFSPCKKHANEQNVLTVPKKR